MGVVIPTRNRVASLPAALDSVLNQTWWNLDIVVVDDASTDGTPAFMRGVSDARVRTVRLDARRGAGGARNRGIVELATEWIAFQDSDDSWSPDKIEKQMKAAAGGDNRNVGVVYCRCRRTAPWGTYVFPPAHARVLSGGLFDVMLGGNLVSTQTALVRRSCFGRWGLFDESLPALEDWELFLRVSRHVEFRFVDEVLVQAPYSGDSLSGKHVEFAKAMARILESYSADYASRPRERARHWGTMADRLCLAGQWKNARRCFARAFRMNPRHVRHAVGWCLAHCPRLYRLAR